jgi:electron transport complex protein RnfD
MGMTTHNMMRDVLIAFGPVVFAAVYYFRWFAVKQLLICVAASLVAETIFTRMQARPLCLGDLSAVVTGVILGLSLPATAPWYVGCIGAVVAMGIGKMVFGGLGMNLFNPAMVGRAFVMIAFAGNLAVSGYIDSASGVDILSQATPFDCLQTNRRSDSIELIVLGSNQRVSW